MAVSDIEYASRHVFGFNRPIEFNWQGERLNLAVIGESYFIAPMGPHCPSRILIFVREIDEEAETVLLADRWGEKELVVSFEDWTFYKAIHFDSSLLRDTDKVKTVADVEKLKRRLQ